MDFIPKSRKQAPDHGAGLSRAHRRVVDAHNRHDLTDAGREERLVTKLLAPARTAAALLYAALDALREVKRDAHKQLVAESHRHPISRVLERKN